MRGVLLAVQYASIIGLFIESWIIFRRLKSAPLSYLFLSCLATLANNVGYLFQLLSTNKESYLVALMFSYGGRVWITLFLLLFTVELCKIRFPNALRNILVIAHIAVYFSIITLKKHNLYYTWTKFSDDGIFPTMSHGNGLVHDSFIILQLIYIAVGFTWLFLEWRKSKNRETKKRLMSVIVSFLIEFIFFAIHMTKPFELTRFYDFTIIGYIIGAAVMFVSFFRYDLLGAREIARDFIIDRLSEGIIVVGTNGNIQYCNKSAKEMYPNMDIDSAKIAQEIQAAAQSGSNININNRVYAAQENELTRGKKQVGKLYVLFDTTERYERFKKEKSDLQMELRLDPLTGLFNRNGMEHFSGLLYNEALKSEKSLFVCICDMNGLKYINDNFGHEEGDRAIRKLSQIIKETAGKDDMAFRIGGDEFLILGIKEKPENAVADFCEKTEKTIAAHNSAPGLPYKVDMSYGPLVKKLSGAPNEFSDLLKESDSLMYEMKKNRDAHIRR